MQNGYKSKILKSRILKSMIERAERSECAPISKIPVNVRKRGTHGPDGTVKYWSIFGHAMPENIVPWRSISDNFLGFYPKTPKRVQKNIPSMEKAYQVPGVAQICWD